MKYFFQVMAMILFLFILGDRKDIVNLGCILKFVAGAKKEPLLDSNLHPSLLFTEIQKQPLKVLSKKKVFSTIFPIS